VRELPGEDGRLYDQAKAEYVARAALLPDDAPSLLNLGKFLFLDRPLFPRAGAAGRGPARGRAPASGEGPAR